MKIFCLILFVCSVAFIGCAVTAYREGDTMTLKGFGAKKATWPEGYSIEKEEPIKIPDLLPLR